MLEATCSFAPVPIATIAITAATPMMIPSIVSPERMGFRLRARSAIIHVAENFTAPPPARAI